MKTTRALAQAGQSLWLDNLSRTLLKEGTLQRLIEDDGIMAMLGWVMTVVTAVWTVFLLVVGPYVVLTLLRNLF